MPKDIRSVLQAATAIIGRFIDSQKFEILAVRMLGTFKQRNVIEIKQREVLAEKESPHHEPSTMSMYLSPLDN